MRNTPHNQPPHVRFNAMLAVVVGVAVAATGCTKPALTPGDLIIDLSPDVTICALDQASSTVDGTSFPVDLHAEKPGTWTLDGVVADPADGITITKSWVLPEPEPDDAVFGVGFPVPPAKDNPAFEPLPFQQAESKPAPQALRPGSAPMGSQVDIRV